MPIQQQQQPAAAGSARYYICVCGVEKEIRIERKRGDTHTQIANASFPLVLV
jgi:hypothetical protein